MYPDNLKYTKTHEWARVDGNIATVGITHYAQDHLGDVVYVEMPPLGKELSAEKEFGVVESVKSVSSLYSPVSGKVVERNEALDKHPELINHSPYEEGWIIKVEMLNPADFEKLLSSVNYQKLLESK